MVAAPGGVKKIVFYVVSPDIKTWNWLVKEDRKSFRKQSINHPLPKKASFFLFCCDFNCRSGYCYRKFLYASRNASTCFGVLRPTLLPNQKHFQTEYLIEVLPRANDFSSDGNEEVLTEKFNKIDHSCSTIKRNILRIQIFILDNHGKINSVARLKSELAISNRQSLLFVAETCLCLKTYIDKIRMCNAHWKIISSDESVKSVAYEFGLNPKSFSRKYYRTFGYWPSENQNRSRVNPRKIQSDII